MHFRTVLASILIITSPICGMAFAAPTDLTMTDGRSTLSVSDLKRELLALPKSVRDIVARDKQQLAKYAASILSNRRAVEAANTSGIAESAEVLAVTAKARREAIARIYIESLLEKAKSTLPNDTAFLQFAKEKYTTNRDAYAIPESLRVAHILFRVNPEDESASETQVRSKAELALDALKKGADFATLAREQSDDGSAKQGGELPKWVTRGMMVPPFEKAAFALKPGEMSGLVRSRFGFHIIKVLEHRPASVRPFEDVREEIVKPLRDQQLNVRRAEIMSEINGTSEVVIDDAVFEALRP